jgi:iron complex transport system substrate-binding protein
MCAGNFFIRQILHVLLRPCRLPALAALLFLTGCPPPQAHNQGPEPESVLYEVTYAKGFSFGSRGAYPVLNLFNQRDTLRYLLLPQSAQAPSDAMPVIRVPAQRAVLLHSSYLAYFDFCGGLSALCGIADPDFIYLESARQMIRDKRAMPVAQGELVDLEQLLRLQPDLVIDVGFPGTHVREQESLRQWGIPVINLSDWQENTALGRAEWVMAIAALLSVIDETAPRFQEVARSYNDLAAQVAAETELRPEVLVNLPFKGIWYMPGGQSYMAGLLRDAGGYYRWQDEGGTGALSLDLESVYSAAHSADVWINPGTAQTRDEIIAADVRMAAFKPLIKGAVYNCDRRTNDAGGNDYWETGIVRPDLVLSDLAAILHPEVLPGHSLYFFRLLE